MRLGEKIKRYRLANKLTQGDFADMAGISRALVCKLEKHEAAGTTKTIQILSVIEKGELTEESICSSLKYIREAQFLLNFTLTVENEARAIVAMALAKDDNTAKARLLEIIKDNQSDIALSHNEQEVKAAISTHDFVAYNEGVTPDTLTQEQSERIIRTSLKASRKRVDTELRGDEEKKDHQQ